ncbi:methyltransferase domain-containing protein [Luteimonas sp. M1R5S18]|uniref:Methyltransferase domain-containing protein n=1 Tax=Luteimonas rhizosphaericola TaxID=3042024 RepID=A0ABT6JKX2_9GAMM|nr:methyltransferase domain-containing protein [Luteimonas rhizosphaericola]MDH5831320.1 methyltransferase domain-containing protein [Luteimonas rhizosphaericola]
MDFDHIHVIRDRESESIVELIQRFEPSEQHLDVPDVGAESGRQAAGLAARAHRVSAIDIDTSAYADNAYPISMYDGKNLPFADASFDVVVSSSVLEHVQGLDGLLADVRCVLRKDGIAVHLVPTHAWCIWTTVARAPWMLKRSWQLISGGRPRRCHSGVESRAHAERRDSMSLVIPGRRDERGTLMAEAWYFSPVWWQRTFRHSAWTPAHNEQCELFHTGTMLLLTRLESAARRGLARFLGRSTHGYVLRPLPATESATTNLLDRQ